jgi:hypothetical protein
MTRIMGKAAKEKDFVADSIGSRELGSSGAIPRQDALTTDCVGNASGRSIQEPIETCDRKSRPVTHLSPAPCIGLPVSKIDGCLTWESVVLTQYPGRQEARFLGGVVQPTGHGSWG